MYNHNNKDKNKIRNRMKSTTHGIILVQTDKNGHRVIAPNKKKYYPNNKVKNKVYR